MSKLDLHILEHIKKNDLIRTWDGDLHKVKSNDKETRTVVCNNFTINYNHIFAVYNNRRNGKYGLVWERKE